MDALRERLDAIRAAYGRLTQREQVIVAAGGGVGFLLILLITGLLISSSISKAEHRVKVNSAILMHGRYQRRHSASQHVFAFLLEFASMVPSRMVLDKQNGITYRGSRTRVGPSLHRRRHGNLAAIPGQQAAHLLLP